MQVCVDLTHLPAVPAHHGDWLDSLLWPPAWHQEGVCNWIMKVSILCSQMIEEIEEFFFSISICETFSPNC